MGYLSEILKMQKDIYILITGIHLIILVEMYS